MSSQCDAPLVRAGVKRFDQATGAPQAEYFSVPDGDLGGSVWSSVAGTSRAVFATTGNASHRIDAGDAYSIVKLDSTTLARIAAYTVPGADGSRLFLSGPLTQIGGVDYRGSVRRVDPATGKPVWETGLAGVVIGTPSINGSGVIAAPIFEVDPVLSGTYLLDATTGGIVRFLPGGRQFAQPTFAGRALFTATQNGVLTAWALP